MPCRRETVLKWDLQGHVCLTDIKRQISRLTRTDDCQRRKKYSDVLLKVATDIFSPRVFLGGFVVFFKKKKKTAGLTLLFPESQIKTTQDKSLFDVIILYPLCKMSKILYYELKS